MYCTECGRELRIGTEQVGVDARNLPLFHRFGYCDNCNMKWDIDLITEQENNVQYNNAPINNVQVNYVPNRNAGIRCPRCGGNQINIDVQNMVVDYGGRTEVRKKSAVTNTANSIGRKSMILATGGLWALTPKKSKYNEIQKGKVRTKQVKTAICQNCGCSWRVY